MKINVIVSTYNWPQALALVLDSLAAQTDRNFEVLVADDGSTRETGEMLAARAAGFPVPLRHIWQEDTGFRLAAIRNRTVAAGRGEYLIFLDGDCAVLPDFVATHRRLAEKGWFVAGNRVLLGEDFTARVLASGEPFYGWSVARFLKARLEGGINRVLPFLKLPVAFGRKLQPRTWQKATGCNLALWRDDFYRVNGFDESFVGWGHEDSEFAGRLINAGIFRKDGRFAAPVLHLWHRTQDRGRAAENMRRVREHLKKKLTRAEVGIDSHQPVAERIAGGPGQDFATD